MTQPLIDADLFARLDAIGVAHRTYDHAPVFTVAESAASAVKTTIPGGHSKNLFLKDKKGRLFLVVAKDDTAIDLKRLHAAIGATGRLSFGSAERLGELLGVVPGSVTPFAVINDREARVGVVLDARLMAQDPVNFHPLRNDRTTSVSPEGLVAFLRSTGHEPTILDLPAPESA